MLVTAIEDPLQRDKTLQPRHADEEAETMPGENPTDLPITLGLRLGSDVSQPSSLKPLPRSPRRGHSIFPGVRGRVRGHSIFPRLRGRVRGHSIFPRLRGRVRDIRYSPPRLRGRVRGHSIFPSPARGAG